MAVRTYGKIYLSPDKKEWHINNAEPHVCIKLKAIFTKIGRGASQPFKFINNEENCFELLWFIERYPLSITDNDLTALKKGKKLQVAKINELEAILLPNYKPQKAKLKKPYKARNYQLKGRDVFLKAKRILIGDDLGLGKSLIGIISALETYTRPCVAVVRTHLPTQWKEAIEQFTDLKIHIIKGTRPYDLPEADIYITKYSCLAGWSNFYETQFFKSAVFDETQELRHEGSNRYNGAMTLSNNVEYVLGLTNTPIYNYGDEIYNVLDVIKPKCLGLRYDFLREWTGGGKSVTNPQALGTYLREQMLMLRRTRAEVGRELPPINKIVHTVEYDEHEVEKADSIARTLAIKVTTSTSFVERGQAARDLDILLRQATGVSKAKYVAEYVKILLDNGEPVLVAGWHRDVYDIWLRELAEYNPVMYTGSETPTQKEKAKLSFINGETNLMIISLRSGVGLDGLQKRCKMVVIGELDWSPKVHDQLIGRVDRDGQKEQVTAIYLVSEYGSDPPIIDMLGVKSSQSHNIMNPLQAVEDQYTDESRIKVMAERYLKNKTSKN